LPAVITALTQGKTYQEVAGNLPDIELVTAHKSMLSDSLTFAEN
jgi:hypothetical protein